MGPTTKAISVTGGVTFQELVTNFHEQARGLLEGGVDLLLVETCQDTRNVKAALVAIEQLRQERRERIAVIVSGTIEATGTMLAGQNCRKPSALPWPTRTCLPWGSIAPPVPSS